MALNGVEENQIDEDGSNYNLPLKHNIKKPPGLNYKSHLQNSREKQYLPKLNTNGSSDNLIVPDV